MDKILSFFEHLAPPFPDVGTETPPHDLIQFILFFSKGLVKFFICIAVLTSVMAAGEALFFTCMGMIVDWTQSTSPSVFMQAYGHKLILMFFLAGVILPISAVIHSLLLHQTISGNFPMQIRWQSHRYLLGQTVSFFTSEYAGRVANKVMQTAMAVRTSVLKLIDVAVHMFVYLVTMLIMLASADLSLTVPLIVWLILYIGSIRIFVPKIRELSAKQADSRSDMVGRIVDSYVNITTVKLFGGRGREEEYAKQSMRDYMKTEYNALRVLTLYDISVQLMNYALLISITILSIMLWSGSYVSAGSIAVAIAISIRVINMSRWMMWEVGVIFESIGTVYDGMNTLSKPRLIEDKAEAIKERRVKGNIEFKNVYFSYVKGKNIIDNFSLKIKEKEKIGIVGPSGMGKTTIINLLLRFYDVNQGEILLDGINIKDYTQDALRDNFALVSQDPSLMHRTIGENILYGTNGSGLDDLKRVASITDSQGFISNLSDYRGNIGFSALVGDRGAKLSGGQRQKIALARVILKDAPILILDEATSALDSQSESIIQDNIYKIMQDKTVIAIAHRLSTIIKMDRIIVVNQGKIVQMGTHEQLVKQEGLYRELWTRQVSGFIGN